MCGIVGLVTAYNNGPSMEEMNVFRDMLVFDSVRGFDSTGVFGVTNKGNVHIVKGAMTGAEFVTNEDYKDWAMTQNYSGQVLVGHNRWATRGTINDANAHPFYKDDKIVLVQNGTFKGGHKHLANTDVDTEAIAHLLAREDNIETALQQVDAAYALVWYNTETKSLYLIRNDERPLYIAYTDQGSMLFASEPNFIMGACYRNNLKLKGAPYLLRDYNLVKITLDDGSWDSDNINGDYKFRQEQTGYDVSYRNFRHQFNNWGLPHAFDEVETEDSWKIQPTASLLNIADVAVEVSLNGYYLMTEKEAENEAAICAKRAPTEPALVQMLDYIPGNKRNDCKCFWVYGTAVGANENKPSPIFYRILTNVSEDEVKEMVHTKEYYWATTSTALRHKIGKQGDTDLYALTTYVTALNEAEDYHGQTTH